MKYCICKPLKPVAKNYWIGLYTGANEVTVLATIRTSRTLKHKKKLNVILDNLIGEYSTLEKEEV